jgi:response regulator RpfG family c-di-GMP phosphodiesterase
MLMPEMNGAQFLEKVREKWPETVRMLLSGYNEITATIDAINNQDFAIVRAMVFLGSVLYVIGLLLTDISYTLVDPRVRLS